MGFLIRSTTFIPSQRYHYSLGRTIYTNCLCWPTGHRRINIFSLDLLTVTVILWASKAFVSLDYVLFSLHELVISNGIVFYQIHFTRRNFAKINQSIDVFITIIYSLPNYIFIGNYFSVLSYQYLMASARSLREIFCKGINLALTFCRAL